MKNAAHLLTGLRLLLSPVLAALPPFSPGFYALYILCGATDIADGAVARSLGTESGLGARFDTAADLVFAAVCAVKLLPALDLPKAVYIFTGIIAAIKLYGIVTGFIRHRRLVSVHCAINKITGLALFVFPFTVRLVDTGISAYALCALAAAAAVWELNTAAAQDDNPQNPK